VPAQAVAAPDLDDAARENELAVDSTLLVNLDMDKKLAPAVYAISGQQGFASTEAPK
jgi:hypothetical protein